LDLVGGAQVALQRQGVAPGVANHACDPIYALGAAGCEHDLGALAGTDDRCRSAYLRADAGDKENFAVQ
jgi:hypothetical protein